MTISGPFSSEDYELPHEKYPNTGKDCLTLLSPGQTGSIMRTP